MRNSIVFAACLGALSTSVCGNAQTVANASAGYVVIDDEYKALRDDFNRAKGNVRLLFVVDPICPGCLRGMDDMNRDLLATTKDARLKTFVVHVPVIGAQAKDVMPSSKLLKNSQVRHYWNVSGAFGRNAGRNDASQAWGRVGLRLGCVASIWPRD